jgi:O-antigen ligase
VPKHTATVGSALIDPDSTFSSFPAAALALSLNGFFLYLGALDLAGVAPRTATTAAWYALMGVLCLAGAWLCRATLIARMRGRPRLGTIWLAGSALLAVWFLADVAFVSEGRLPKVFAAQLVLWSLPSAALALALPRSLYRRFAWWAASLGGLFVAIEAVSALHAQATGGRFSPLSYLDPISAAQYAAFGAVALLAAGPGDRRTRHAAACALLVAGTLLPGARGPIVALLAGVVVILAVTRRQLPLAIAAVVAGLALGAGATAVVGSSCYLTYSTPGIENGQGCGATSIKGPPISTFHIRWEWWRAAARAVPDDPVVGHGVAMFVDDTPEAHRMGVAGTRTYPHNSPLESAYSLGAVGAVLYALFAGGALVALVRLVRTRDVPAALVAGLWTFAFASANLSGEIGADASVWAASALALGLYAERAVSR